MKPISITKILIFLVVTTSFAFGQQQTFSPDEQELVDLIKKLNIAEANFDYATADSIKSEQHLAVLGNLMNLRTADKKQLDESLKNLSSRANGEYQRISTEFSDFKVNLLGENAVVLAKTLTTDKINKQILLAKFQYIYFLSKKDGKWRVIAWQMFPLNYSRFPRSEQVTFEVLPLSEKVKGFTWNKIADDKQNDGMRPTSADGKTLSYFYENAADTLWFKFELYNEVDKDRPAVSLSIDLDNDQNTGTNWWGTISSFKFDKILNLGVSEKICDTKVKGYNGITSNTDSIIGNWLNEKKSNLIFHSNPEEKAYYLGVKRADLGLKTNKINIVGSVGASGAWNDDFGENMTTIEMPN